MVRLNRIQDIVIHQCDHGYLVTVGCQTFVFETSERVIAKLTMYLHQPDAVEKAWTEGKLNL